MTFLWTFWFCKICLKSWYLRLETKKKYCALFVDVFSCTISSWNFSHKYDISNHILVFIHVKKTFRALQCQKFGTYFKKNWGITKHLQKKAWSFLLCPVKDINISDIFYKIQKFLAASWASIITTNGINFLMAGPLDTRISFVRPSSFVFLLPPLGFWSGLDWRLWSNRVLLILKK